MVKKRGSGEGSIYKRKDGRWVGQYTVQTAEGPKYRYVYGKIRQVVAEKLTKAMADRDGGLTFDAGKVKVEEYLDRWLSDSVRDTVRPGTFRDYEWLIRRHIKPTLGRVKLKSLTPVHARRLYREKLDSGLSSRTVNYIHVTLHKALKQAVNDGLIPRNVTDAVKAPRPIKKEVQSFTPDQAHVFLEAARGDRLEALYVIAITTGLRQGELLGLRWTDIDLDSGKLAVRRVLVAGSVGSKAGPAFDAPKNNKSRRTVKLVGPAVEALKRHKAAQNAERLKLGSLWKDHGLVFPNRVGKPMDHNNLYKRDFKKMLKKAELPNAFRFHDLRHTCATLLLLENVNPKIVQETLGHAMITQTMDTYSHVLPTMQDAATEAMESVLYGG
jgi:integrase